jgi:hypothetical protein
MSTSPRLESILAQIAEYVRAVYGERVWAVELIVRLSNGRKVQLPVPGEHGGAESRASAAPFVPNEMQSAILEALAGVALTADALAGAAGYDRRTLYRRPGGLAELLAHGLIEKGADGYFRPDAPPD